MLPSDHAIHAMTTAGLDLIQQALSIFDSDLRLIVANRPMQEMFNLPGPLVTPGANFEDVIRYLAERGEYGQIDDIPSMWHRGWSKPAPLPPITWSVPAPMAA